MGEDPAMTVAETLADDPARSAKVAESIRFAECLRDVAERGDREAFMTLYDHFAPRLASYMTRAGASPAQAEDLMQDAMLAVWRKAALFDPAKASAATWIFTIARNLRIDLLRRDRRPTVDIGALDLADPSDGAEATVDAARRADRVRRAVAALPPEQAEVIRLSYFDGLPHPEIAARLNIPLGTVKSRLRLAFKKVRGALADETMGDPA